MLGYCFAVSNVNVQELRNEFAMLQSVGQDPERERLNLRIGVVGRTGVGHHARQLDNLGYPALVLLLLCLDHERLGTHDPYYHLDSSIPSKSCRARSISSACWRVQLPMKPSNEERTVSTEP